MTGENLAFEQTSENMKVSLAYNSFGPENFCPNIFMAGLVEIDLLLEWLK